MMATFLAQSTCFFEYLKHFTPNPHPGPQIAVKREKPHEEFRCFQLKQRQTPSSCAWPASVL